jgi:hypothetical protein
MSEKTDKSRRSCACVWAGPILQPVLVECCPAHAAWSESIRRADRAEFAVTLENQLKENTQLREVIGRVCGLVEEYD